MCLTILWTLSIIRLNQPVSAKIANHRISRTLTIICCMCISILEAHGTALKILHGNKLTNYLNHSDQ